MPSLQTTVAYRARSATIGSSAIQISDVSFGWQAGELAAAEVAILTARGAGVMYLYDGTAPSATLGHLLAQNGTVEVVGNANIQALRFIREGASDATMTVTLKKNQGS
jgi:hypothetical protein